MKSFLIDPETRTVTEQNFDGQPNSLYNLFNSLLVDNNAILNKHMVYTGTEAFERGQKGFFLGEKLLFGRALVTGYAGFEEIDATIRTDELEALLLFELPEFYTKVIALLPPEFSFEETFELSLGNETESVTPEWVLYVFNMADANTKTYFLNKLESSVTQGENVMEYLKKMGGLAIKSMQ